MKCDSCSKEIECSCLQEQNTRLKYRSCALRQNSYPRSQLDMSGRLVHLCSKDCDRIFAQKFRTSLLEKFGGNVTFVDTDVDDDDTDYD